MVREKGATSTKHCCGKRATAGVGVCLVSLVRVVVGVSCALCLCLCRAVSLLNPYSYPFTSHTPLYLGQDSSACLPGCHSTLGGPWFAVGAWWC